MITTDRLRKFRNFFYLFLITNSILWCAVSLCRNLISRDAMEAVIWGDLISFGTNKHPPLSGWLASGFYHLFGEHDLGIYVLGQLCIIIAFIYLFKLAKKFLAEDQALCATLSMTPCLYYTYQAFYDNFNCNYISITLWVMLVYYFYNAVKEHKLTNWLLVGVIAGLSFLAKYQVIFLFFPMFCYLLIYERSCFKQYSLYLGATIAVILILPHLYWLYQNDFFSFNYLIGRTEAIITNPTIMQRLTFPTKFYLDQLVALLPCLLLYLMLALKERNVYIRKFDRHNKDLMFILLISLLPMFTIATMGAFTSSRIVGAWAATMIGFMGIAVFYIFPINIKPTNYPFFSKAVCGLMLLWLSAMLIFVSIQTKIDMGYPTKIIMPQIDQIWRQATNNAPLKYVRGDYKNGFQFRLYHPQKPTVILETFGHPNPWIDFADIKKSGLLIVSFTPQTNLELAKEFASIIPPNFTYASQRFTYTIKNIFNKQKSGEFYYLIIPPTEK